MPVYSRHAIQSHSSSLPRLFRRPRAPRGAFFVTGPGGRSDAAVHQRRHGPVQADFPGSGATRLPRGPTTCQKCVRAGGQAQRSRAGGPHARGTTRSSRCSATSPSATTSSGRRSHSPGSSSPERAYLGLAPDRLRVTVHQTDDEARALWREVAGVCPTTGSTAWGTRTTSGRWETPALRSLHRDLRRPRME